MNAGWRGASPLILAWGAATGRRYAAACPHRPVRSAMPHAWTMAWVPAVTSTIRRWMMRLENEAVLDRMDARMAQHPDILQRRRETVEHPFGSIKQWMNQGAFLMRRLRNVRAEFSLTALAYNLRRVLNIVEFPTLMAALQA